MSAECVASEEEVKMSSYYIIICGQKGGIGHVTLQCKHRADSGE